MCRPSSEMMTQTAWQEKEDWSWFSDGYLDVISFFCRLSEDERRISITWTRCEVGGYRWIKCGLNVWFERSCWNRKRFFPLNDAVGNSAGWKRLGFSYLSIIHKSVNQSASYVYSTDRQRNEVSSSQCHTLNSHWCSISLLIKVEHLSFQPPNSNWSWFSFAGFTIFTAAISVFKDSFQSLSLTLTDTWSCVHNCYIWYGTECWELFFFFCKAELSLKAQDLQLMQMCFTKGSRVSWRAQPLKTCYHNQGDNVKLWFHACSDEHLQRTSDEADLWEDTQQAGKDQGDLHLYSMVQQTA